MVAVEPVIKKKPRCCGVFYSNQFISRNRFLKSMLLRSSFHIRLMTLLLICLLPFMLGCKKSKPYAKEKVEICNSAIELELPDRVIMLERQDMVSIRGGEKSFSNIHKDSKELSCDKKRADFVVNNISWPGFSVSYHVSNPLQTTFDLWSSLTKEQKKFNEDKSIGGIKTLPLNRGDELWLLEDTEDYVYNSEPIVLVCPLGHDNQSLRFIGCRSLFKYSDVIYVGYSFTFDHDDPEGIKETAYRTAYEAWQRADNLLNSSK